MLSESALFDLESTHEALYTTNQYVIHYSLYVCFFLFVHAHRFVKQEVN
jgi:hypothetical protein